MEHVNELVSRLRLMVVANVYLVRTSAKRYALVDTGHMVQLPSILAQLRALGLGPGDLEAVLLTHRHSDHAGNALFFQRLGVPIVCHAEDAHVLAGRRPRSRLRRPADSHDMAVLGALAEIENRLPARGFEPNRVVEQDDEVFGFHVHWVPGHTEGSVFLRHVESRTLFTGDTLLTSGPTLPMRSPLREAFATFSVDHPRAIDSLLRFMGGGPAFDSVCAGHGRPISTGGDERVRAFIQRRFREMSQGLKGAS